MRGAISEGWLAELQSSGKRDLVGLHSMVFWSQKRMVRLGGNAKELVSSFVKVQLTTEFNLLFRIRTSFSTSTPSNCKVWVVHYPNDREWNTGRNARGERQKTMPSARCTEPTRVVLGSCSHIPTPKTNSHVNGGWDHWNFVTARLSVGASRVRQKIISWPFRSNSQEWN